MSEITSIRSSENIRINGEKVAGREKTPDEAKSTSSAQKELSKEEKQQVQELKKTDRGVRAHEMAHMAAGGQYVRGGPTYEYEQGPDGVRYAVGGEVSIDTSPVKGDPAATIMKMEAVRRAALAPASPSGQDRSVAASAAAQMASARQELNQSNAPSSGTQNDDIRIGAQYNSKGAASSVDTQKSAIDLQA